MAFLAFFSLLGRLWLRNRLSAHLICRLSDKTCSFSFLVITVAYIYGDGAERIYNVSLTKNIDQFENL
jgi:hypothetical protein